MPRKDGKLCQCKREETSRGNRWDLLQLTKGVVSMTNVKLDELSVDASGLGSNSSQIEADRGWSSRDAASSGAKTWACLSWWRRPTRLSRMGRSSVGIQAIRFRQRDEGPWQPPSWAEPWDEQGLHARERALTDWRCGGYPDLVQK